MRLEFFLPVIATLLGGLVGCQYFQRKPESGQYYKERWQEAQLLSREKNDIQAEAVYREIYLNAYELSPDLSTQALFELSVLSENNGDWEQALIQLKECEQKKSNLPLIRAELELPARLSGLYATLGSLEMSDRYFRKTESALQVYAAQFRQDQQASWWAETYFKMGSSPVQSMAEANWGAFAKRFESTAPYLIRSMEFSDPLWSQRSFDLLQTFLKRSIELMSNLENYDQENWVAKTEELKIRLVTMAALIEKMKLWKPLNVQKSNYAWSFFESLEMTEKSVQSRLSQFRSHTPQSLESLERNSILRRGRIQE